MGARVFPKELPCIDGVWRDKDEGTERKYFKKIKENTEGWLGGSRIKLAGVINQKPKYKPNSPIITPIELPENEGMFTSEAELIAEGIIEKEEVQKEKKEVPSPLPHVQKKSRKFYVVTSYRVEPYYAEYVARAPLNKEGKAPDISRADFAFCRAIYRRGFGEEEIVRILMRESKCAKGAGGEKYSKKTVKRVLANLEKEGFFRYFNIK